MVHPLDHMGYYLQRIPSLCPSHQLVAQALLCQVHRHPLLSHKAARNLPYRKSLTCIIKETSTFTRLVCQHWHPSLPLLSKLHRIRQRLRSENFCTFCPLHIVQKPSSTTDAEQKNLTQSPHKCTRRAHRPFAANYSRISLDTCLAYIPLVTFHPCITQTHDTHLWDV